MNVEDVIHATMEAANYAQAAAKEAQLAANKVHTAVAEATDYGQVASEVYGAAAATEQTAAMNLELAKRHTPPFIYAHAGRKSFRGPNPRREPTQASSASSQSSASSERGHANL